MKKAEIKLLSELMKNSRRSDRELSRVIGVSQPTVSRMISKLEKEGVIKEYTMIPDFLKLGYKIVAMVFVKVKPTLKPEELAAARRTAVEDFEKKGPSEIVVFERGLGADFAGVIISFHKDYSSYLHLIRMTKEYPFLDHSSTTSFLIDLEDKVHYRSLTFRTLAENLLALAQAV